MRWKVFWSGIVTSVVVGLVLGFYFASLSSKITVGMVFGPVFAIGLAISLITALQIWAHTVRVVKTWGPTVCLVISFIWARHLLGALFNAPLFVEATNYTGHPETGMYLVYAIGDGYQRLRAFSLDAALVLAGIVALSGIAAGATWYKRIIYWTMILNLLLTVFWLAFPSYWDQAAGMFGYPTTRAGRMTKYAFEQAFQQKLAEKENQLKALLDRQKPVAPGSPAPVLTTGYWEQVAALKKEMGTMQEDHLKEGKRLFPDLYEEAAKKNEGAATQRAPGLTLTLAKGQYTDYYQSAPRLRWTIVGPVGTCILVQIDHRPPTQDCVGENYKHAQGNTVRFAAKDHDAVKVVLSR